MLLPALENDAVSLAALRCRVAQGDASLLGIYADDVLVCAIVFSTEGSDAVLLAAGGSWAGHSLVDAVLPIMELGFRNAGFAFCRVDTFRRGLMERLSKVGYSPAFVAFRKAL